MIAFIHFASRARAAGVSSATLLLALMLLALPSAPAAARRPPTDRAVLDQVVYLPLVGVQVDTIFGLDATSLTPERGLEGMVALGASWVRGNNNLLWRDVEPVEGGGYRWEAPSVQLAEQEMINAASHNLKMVLVVRGSPAWATAPYQADCAPINAAKYARFAAFMAAAVARYSRPPYNVGFWEIGNEPDAPIFPADSGFGCWGQSSDPYFGGRAYGALLKATYPAMKAQADGIKVLNGGLLLDRPYSQSDPGSRSGRFFEGMLVAGAGASFDILSFHSYSFYNGSVDGSRGASDWKVGYLRELMQRYNIPAKPLLNTETALLCSEPSDGCQQAQSAAIPRYYARARADDLLGQLWYLYDSDAFNNTALVEPSDVTMPRPAYRAYSTAVLYMGGAQYLGPLADQGAGIEGYRFSRAGQVTIVFWSDVLGQASIPVAPTAEVACFDSQGTPLACQAEAGVVRLAAQPAPSYVVIR